jgi:hypothetical protein
MDEQFLNILFQTSLYFFSSLLQADAAILGFGTIFIIFKLQSLDSIKQGIIQAYYTKGGGHTGAINSLLLSDKPNEIANTLFSMKSDAYNYKNYLYIVLIPTRSALISTSIKWPVKVIGLHTIICALLLGINLFFRQYVVVEFIILAFTFIWFAYGVYLAASLAISLLTKNDDYRLEELRPDIYACMCEKENRKNEIAKNNSPAA